MFSGGDLCEDETYYMGSSGTTNVLQVLGIFDHQGPVFRDFYAHGPSGNRYPVRGPSD